MDVDVDVDMFVDVFVENLFVICLLYHFVFAKLIACWKDALIIFGDDLVIFPFMVPYSVYISCSRGCIDIMCMDQKRLFLNNFGNVYFLFLLFILDPQKFLGVNLQRYIDNKTYLFL